MPKVYAIFEDINNGHPTDFLPWLSPLFNKYLNDVHSKTSTIRNFILKKIIKDRPENFDADNINDLVDALLSNYKVNIYNIFIILMFYIETCS